MNNMQDYIKRLSMIWMLSVLALLLLRVEAQPITVPTQLAITYNKTTSIIFPTVIKSVDRGSRDVMAQKVKGVENVLQLKAAREGFRETNLTVITADGIIHEFIINYAKEPGQLVLSITETDDDSDERNQLIFETAVTEADLEKYAKRILQSKKSVRWLKDGNHKVHIALMGIYVKDNIIFYNFRITNRSNINYDVDYFRFFIRDKTKAKRTASQEVAQEPLFIYGNVRSIKGNSIEDVVCALEKFTIPDAKRLVIELYERKGGRHLKLFIKNKTIVNARLIE